MSDQPFELGTRAVGAVLVVAVAGEVDMATSPRLVSALESVSDGILRVVVDLTAVEFLDSSGLNALIRGQKALAHRATALHVVAPTGSAVRRVIEITQLTAPLHVVDTLAHALAATDGDARRG